MAGAHGRRTAAARRPSPPASPAAPIETSLGRDEYIRAVEVAKDAIAAGEAIQVVLARRQSFDLPTDPATGAPLDGIGLYRALRRVNPSPYLFFVRTPSFEVVGARPELLLQVEGDRLTTHPIAGTRPRGADAREDALLAEQLQRDPKERAEHVMLVDLGRNDLGPGRPAGHRDRQQVHGGRALQPRPPPRVSHVEARLRPELDALDALRGGLPGRHPVGRAEGPRDAADRRRRGRAARAVRRRGRLPRLRRQPRHGDHDPERGPQGRPGARPHRRRDRGRLASRRRSSRRPSTRRRRCAGRSSWRPGVPDAPRRRTPRRPPAPTSAEAGR